MAAVQDEQRREVNSRLQGNLVDAGVRPRGGARGSTPEWLQVAAEQEWPHYWVADYTRSVMLEVKGDVRCAVATPLTVALAAPGLLHGGPDVAVRLK